MPHARAAIISQGDEIVLGQTLDTNSKWLSERLVDLGIVPVEHAGVPDDAAAITGALRRLAQTVDLILCTGGLGPTADDLTREALAAAMGQPLVEDAESLAQIQAWFARRNRGMPKLNRVQALRPEGSVAIQNFNGTAPGIRARIEGDSRGADVFCLPGPPAELRPMFDRQVAPLLAPPPGRVVRTGVVHTVGLGESDLATMLKGSRLGDLMARDRVPMVGTTASGGVVSARIRYEGTATTAHAEQLVSETRAVIRELAGPHAFAEDGEAHLALPAAVIAALRQRKQSLAVAESCTAGLLGAMIGDVPGASDVFVGGFITYANDLKTSQLGVPAAMFNLGEDGPAPGAVSRECATAMALGALQRTGAAMALSVTGIAGPGGGSAQKPVGTVYIGLAWKETGGPGTECRKFAMAGDRRTIREWSARSALAVLWLRLKGSAGVRLLRQVEG